MQTNSHSRQQQNQLQFTCWYYHSVQAQQNGCHGGATENPGVENTRPKCSNGKRENGHYEKPKCTYCACVRACVCVCVCLCFTYVRVLRFFDTPDLLPYDRRI